MLTSDLRTPQGRVHMVVRNDDPPEFCFHGKWTTQDMHFVWEAIVNAGDSVHLNLHECTYLDSGAAGILMSIVRDTYRNGAPVRFCYPGATMSRILELNGMAHYIIREPSACALARACSSETGAGVS